MSDKFIPAFLWAVAVMNVITFITYGVDKRRAIKNKWRISEARLLGMAFAFGGIGAFFGMFFFHHKTKHKKFVILLPIAYVVQVAVIVLAVMYSVL